MQCPSSRSRYLIFVLRQHFSKQKKQESDPDRRAMTRHRLEYVADDQSLAESYSELGYLFRCYLGFSIQS